jgi:hypothetical protein
MMENNHNHNHDKIQESKRITDMIIMIMSSLGTWDIGTQYRSVPLLCNAM